MFDSARRRVESLERLWCPHVRSRVSRWRPHRRSDYINGSTLARHACYFRKPHFLSGTVILVTREKPADEKLGEDDCDHEGNCLPCVSSAFRHYSATTRLEEIDGTHVFPAVVSHSRRLWKNRLRRRRRRDYQPIAREVAIDPHRGGGDGDLATSLRNLSWRSASSKRAGPDGVIPLNSSFRQSFFSRNTKSRENQNDFFILKVQTMIIFGYRIWLFRMLRIK